MLPEGWRVGEDGQFALTLLAPDNKAFTVMAGNAGRPPNYPPAQFVTEKLMAMRPQQLRLGQPRPTKPVAGFAQAVEFDVSYSVGGVALLGVAKCNVQTAYDSPVMAMTWAGYAKWLPQVADQISASNGAAFGVRGMMAQNLRNSTAYAEAARSYREWSQRNWQQVTDARNQSQDRNNAAVRENPFGEDRKVGSAAQRGGYGRSIGGSNPGSSTEWRQMKRPK
jgi:hypothetical protein